MLLVAVLRLPGQLLLYSRPIGLIVLLVNARFHHSAELGDCESLDRIDRRGRRMLQNGVRFFAGRLRHELENAVRVLQEKIETIGKEPRAERGLGALVDVAVARRCCQPAGQAVLLPLSVQVVARGRADKYKVEDAPGVNIEVRQLEGASRDRVVID